MRQRDCRHGAQRRQGSSCTLEAPLILLADQPRPQQHGVPTEARGDGLRVLREINAWALGDHIYTWPHTRRHWNPMGPSVNMITQSPGIDFT